LGTSFPAWEWAEGPSGNVFSVSLDRA